MQLELTKWWKTLNGSSLRGRWKAWKSCDIEIEGESFCNGWCNQQQQMLLNEKIPIGFNKLKAVLVE